LGRTRQVLYAGHPGGGSLALSELLDGEHGEALYIDLLKHFSLDLVGFLRGDVASSPRLILTMIRHLPEGSNYVSALQSAPVTEPVTDEPTEIDPVQENKLWTMDKLLMAQLINSVNMLVRHSINWGDKPPTLPIVGPAKWRGEGPESATETKPESVDDTLNRIMGRKK
jgi:hypothetical protein